MVAALQGNPDSGREAWAFADLADIDYGAGSQAANLVTENAQVLAGINAGHKPLINYELGTAGLMFSHARVASAGNILVGLGVSAGGAADGVLDEPRFGRIHDGIHRAPPAYLIATPAATPTQIPNAQWQSGVSDDTGDIAANASEARQVNITGAAGFIAIASPVNALAAGIAYSHPFIDASGDVFVVMHNLTALGVDPGPVNFDFVFLRATPFQSPLTPNLINTAPCRTSPSGMITAITLPLTIDSAQIANDVVVETAFTVPGTGPYLPTLTTVVMVTPRAALPAGIALSHGRMTGAGAGVVGLANLTGAPIDPAALTLDATFFIPPER